MGNLLINVQEPRVHPVLVLIEYIKTRWELICLPTFNSILVTGSQTINQDLQVNGNETIGVDLQVNGSQTIANSLQINDSASITNNLGVGGVIEAGDSVKAATQLMALNQPTLPAVLPALQIVEEHRIWLFRCYKRYAKSRYAEWFLSAYRLFSVLMMDWESR